MSTAFLKSSWDKHSPRCLSFCLGCWSCLYYLGIIFGIMFSAIFCTSENCSDHFRAIFWDRFWIIFGSFSGPRCLIFNYFWHICGWLCNILWLFFALKLSKTWVPPYYTFERSAISANSWITHCIPISDHADLHLYWYATHTTQHTSHSSVHFSTLLGFHFPCTSKFAHQEIE